MKPIFSAWIQRSQPGYEFAKPHPTRVLVVEDELIIGEIAVEALEEAGFAVLTAASAEEAEVILSQEPVDVLFTDINLGGKDGFELADRAHVLQPSLSVVFTSGRSRKCHGDRASTEAAFLPKPYRLLDMLREIETAARKTTYQ